MILTQHIPIMDEILALPDFLNDPILSFGYQDVIWHDGLVDTLNKHKFLKKDLTVYMKLREALSKELTSEMFAVNVPWQFIENSFNRILANFGKSDISTIDLFDKRSNYKHDMNVPIEDNLKNRFNTLIDIGSTEHVFDTRQCLENLFNMLRTGGHIMLHLPCSCFFNHGFYTFSPEAIVESLRLNGFDIVYLAYSLEPEGIKMDTPVVWSDCNLWCVARKIREEKNFVIPQQKGCQVMYGLTMA
jgi:hypothetical protein